MVKTFGDYLVILLSIIGSIASIVAFGIYFGPSLNSQGWVAVFFLGILTFVFLGYNFYLILTYRKKVRYAEVFSIINQGFSSLHKIDRLDDINAKELIQNLIGLCDSISEAFTLINGHNIGACIKILITENDRPRVETLVRDKKSSLRGRKTGKSDKVKHWLDQNSDFDFIYSNFDDENIDTTFFFENWLSLRRNYRNTRLNNHWPPRKLFFLLDWINRLKSWPLVYRCTLVVPIVPMFANEQEKSTLRGFLCIDSPRNMAFNQKVDVDILKGISDGLYNKIDKLHSLILIPTSS